MSDWSAIVVSLHRSPNPFVSDTPEAFESVVAQGTSAARDAPPRGARGPRDPSWNVAPARPRRSNAARVEQPRADRPSAPAFAMAPRRPGRARRPGAGLAARLARRLADRTR